MEYGATESNFRNSSPISKNEKFWILDGADRISKIMELLTTFVNNLQRHEIFSLQHTVLKGEDRDGTLDPLKAGPKPQWISIFGTWTYAQKNLNPKS